MESKQDKKLAFEKSVDLVISDPVYFVPEDDWIETRHGRDLPFLHITEETGCEGWDCNVMNVSAEEVIATATSDTGLCTMAALDDIMRYNENAFKGVNQKNYAVVCDFKGFVLTGSFPDGTLRIFGYENVEEWYEEEDEYGEFNDKYKIVPSLFIAAGRLLGGPDYKPDRDRFMLGKEGHRWCVCERGKGLAYEFSEGYFSWGNHENRQQERACDWLSFYHPDIIRKSFWRFDPKPVRPTSGYSIQETADGWWMLADKKTGACLHFKAGHFKEMQHTAVLDDTTPVEAAHAIAEMSDWLARHRPDLI